MKRTILLITTNYPGFLEQFYSDNPEYTNKSYSQIKNLLFQQCFGSSNFYSKHLSELGWEPRDIIANDWHQQSKWAVDHDFAISRDERFIYKYIPEYVLTALGVRNWIKKIVIEQIKYYSPEVVYTHHLGLFNNYDIKLIKNYAKLLVGQIASPLPIDKKPLYNYDLIISSLPNYVKMFRKMGIHSEYLKWAAESDLANKIVSKKRDLNVVCVGGYSPLHSRGNRQLEKLAREIKVDFWGYGEKTLSPLSPIRSNFHGQAWGKEMYKIFSRSKIVINRHINIADGYANNLRMYEATLMGALLITDDKKNMNEFFDVGKEVVTYKNTDDLINKVKYFLSAPREARKIARKGQARTLKNHNYKIRMNELNEILLKYLNHEQY